MDLCKDMKLCYLLGEHLKIPLICMEVKKWRKPSQYGDNEGCYVYHDS